MKSPARAVKKMWRGGSKEKSKELGSDGELELDTLDSSVHTHDDVLFHYSFSNDEDDPNIPPHKKAGNQNPSTVKKTKNNSKSCGVFNPSAPERLVSRSKKKKKGLEEGSSSEKKKTKRRGSGGNLIGGSKVAVNDSEGYNSDGAISKKKKEIRAKLRAKETMDLQSFSPEAFKSNKSNLKPKKRTSLKAKLTSIGGLDESIKSTGSSVSKMEGSAKKKTLNCDELEHSLRLIGSNVSKPRASTKKTLNCDDHSVKSSKSTVSKRKSCLKKNPNPDGLEHNVKSPESSTAGNRKSSIKKKDPKNLGLDDGSDDSHRSTSSSTGRKESPKKSRKSTEGRRFRGGKRYSTLDESGYNSDGQLSVISAKSSKGSTKEKETTTRGGKTTPLSPRKSPMPAPDALGDEYVTPLCEKKNSLSAFLSAGIKFDLEDDDAISAPSRTQSSLDSTPTMPRRTPDLEPAELMSQGSALTLDLSQPPDEHVLHTKSLELQLDEEVKKNIDLPRSLIPYQQQDEAQSDEMFLGSALNENLRRQVDTLMEEKEPLDVKIRTVAQGLEHSRRGTDNSDIASMSADQLRTELIQTRSKLSDRDAMISSMSEELDVLKKQVRGSTEAQQGSETEKKVIEALKLANETMEETLKLERSEMDSKLKVKMKPSNSLCKSWGK
jgi:hypothetical protein